MSDYLNKNSSDNFAYYSMIFRHRNNVKTVFAVAELWLMWKVLFVYGMGTSFFMPALIILILKNIWFIISKNQIKTIVSLAVDIAAAVIVFSGEGLSDSFIGILADLTIGIPVIPSLAAHLISAVHGCCDRAVSTLPGYPYFTSLSYSSLNDEYIGFDNSISDTVLRYWLSFRRKGNAKAVAAAGSALLLAVAVTVAAGNIREASTLRKADFFTGSDIYHKGKYVTVEVKNVSLKPFTSSDRYDYYWEKPLGEDKYYCLRIKKSVLSEYLSGEGNNENDMCFKGKVSEIKNSDLINVSSLSDILGKTGSELTDEDLTYLESLVNKSGYVDVLEIF